MDYPRVTYNRNRFTGAREYRVVALVEGAAMTAAGPFETEGEARTAVRALVGPGLESFAKLDRGAELPAPVAPHLAGTCVPLCPACVRRLELGAVLAPAAAVRATLRGMEGQ